MKTRLITQFILFSLICLLCACDGKNSTVNSGVEITGNSPQTEVTKGKEVLDNEDQVAQIKSDENLLELLATEKERFLVILENIEAKIALTNTRYMWETGNPDLTYEVAMRLADVAERTVLLARALPACTGNPIAAIEIQNLIDVSIRVDVGLHRKGGFLSGYHCCCLRRSLDPQIMCAPFSTRQ